MTAKIIDMAEARERLRPKCEKCGERMMPGQPTITVQTATRQKTVHRACFGAPK